MAKAIHGMIRVLNEERSVNFYRQAFGLAVAERIVLDGFTLVYLRNDEADFELELTVNHGRREPYAPGDGYGHMAFAVDEVESEHVRLERLGFPVRPVKEFMREGHLFAKFFFVSDPDGYQIEVLQKHGRFG